MLGKRRRYLRVFKVLLVGWKSARVIPGYSSSIEHGGLLTKRTFPRETLLGACVRFFVKSQSMIIHLVIFILLGKYGPGFS